MAPILYIWLLLLLTVDFTIGDDCNPCDLYTDPTSPLARCGMRTDSALWAQVHQDCEEKKSNALQLEKHFSTIVAFCALKAVNLKVDFTVCPPVKVDIGCSFCEELIGKATGIKQCADSLPPLIWGSIILDCKGYEDSGDIRGRNDLMTNLETLCEAKKKPASFSCLSPQSDGNMAPKRVTVKDNFEGNLSGRIPEMEDNPTKSSITQPPASQSPATQPSSTQTESPKPSSAKRIRPPPLRRPRVRHNVQFDDNPAKTSITQPPASESPAAQPSSTQTESPKPSSGQRIRPPPLRRPRVRHNVQFDDNPAKSSIAQPPASESPAAQPTPAQIPCVPCDFNSSTCYLAMSDQIQSAILRDCTALAGTDGYQDLFDNLAVLCAAKQETAIEATSCVHQ